jgi:hypothetical protein
MRLTLDISISELEEGFEPPTASLQVRNSGQTELFQHNGQFELDTQQSWRLQDLNPPPSACKADALPDELNPLGASPMNQTQDRQVICLVLFRLS